jgi:hypothetical protein
LDVRNWRKALFRFDHHGCKERVSDGGSAATAVEQKEAMTEDKKQPWDAALETVKDSVNGAIKSVQTAVGGNVQQVKELARGPVEQASELTSSARLALGRARKEAADGAKAVVRPVVQVFEQAESQEGTPLRKQIAVVRESVNHQFYDVQVRADCRLPPLRLERGRKLSERGTGHCR